MSDQFEFEHARAEGLIIVRGPAADELTRSLFGELPAAGRLEYRPWQPGLEPAAVSWFPPDQLELRVPAADAPRLLARLSRLRAAAADSPYARRIKQLVARLEAWSYADSDSGIGPAEAVAGELGELAREAPSLRVRRSIAEARDALDDGLPAERIAGTLDRALRELESANGDQDSGLEPSASG